MSTQDVNIDRNMPILIIDDLSMVRRVVKNCLHQLGFENISEATNAAEAQESLDATQCRLIITDWQLDSSAIADTAQGPQTSWREVADKCTAPVLLIGSEAQRKSLEEQLNAAPNGERVGYLVKPFTAQILEEKILALCANHSAV